MPIFQFICIVNRSYLEFEAPVRPLVYLVSLLMHLGQYAPMVPMCSCDIVVRCGFKQFFYDAIPAGLRFAYFHHRLLPSLLNSLHFTLGPKPPHPSFPRKSQEQKVPRQVSSSTPNRVPSEFSIVQPFRRYQPSTSA